MKPRCHTCWNFMEFCTCLTTIEPDQVTEGNVRYLDEYRDDEPSIPPDLPLTAEIIRAAEDKVRARWANGPDSSRLPLVYFNPPGDLPYVD